MTGTNIDDSLSHFFSNDLCLSLHLEEMGDKQEDQKVTGVTSMRRGVEEKMQWMRVVSRQVEGLGWGG
jgi:hypothetical protein